MTNVSQDINSADLAMLNSLSLEDLRERFYYEASEESQGWPKVEVKVFDKNASTTQPIYQYSRNYSMMKTFEPFRLWDASSSQWRHFALISPEYYSFQVIDLDNREVIAKNPYPKLTKQQAYSMNELFENRGEEPKYSEGQEMVGLGFCPMDFHVPDPLDILDARDFSELKEELESNEVDEDTAFWAEWLKDLLKRRTFGLMSGCVWGDDWSSKIQAINLTRVLEGVVSNDDRFGYFVLSGKLEDSYDKSYFDGSGAQRFSLKTAINFEFDPNDEKRVVKSYSESEIPSFTLNTWE